MSNVRGHPFGMVMQADFFLMELFLSEGGCLEKIIRAEMELVVIEMVVGEAARVVWANLGVLLEVVVLV